MRTSILPLLLTTVLLAPAALAQTATPALAPARRLGNPLAHGDSLRQMDPRSGA